MVRHSVSGQAREFTAGFVRSGAGRGRRPGASLETDAAVRAGSGLVRDKERETKRDRERQRETERDGERQRQKKRGRERQREAERP